MINEKTLIPIGLVVTLLTFAGWVGRVHSETETNTHDIEQIRADRSVQLLEMNKMVGTIREQLGTMDGKIQYIYDATIKRERVMGR